MGQHVSVFQEMLKKGQRLYTNSGCASWGMNSQHDWCLVNKKEIVCIAGDVV